MSDYIRIEFPKNCDEFMEGLVLLDEAVCRFGISDNRHAETLERLISAIVREFDHVREYEEE